MYYNQELGLCIEFGPVRNDSIRRGGAPLDQIPPGAGSRRHGLLPGLLVIACYLSFTPSSLKFRGCESEYFNINFWPACPLTSHFDTFVWSAGHSDGILGSDTCRQNHLYLLEYFRV